MSRSFVKIDVHLIFHIKTTSPRLEQGDFERIWLYIGGIIRNTRSLTKEICPIVIFLSP